MTQMRNGTTSKQIDDVTPYPVTRIETISDGTINLSKVKYLMQSEPNYRLISGDILYSHINSVAHIGKVALFDHDKELYHGMNLMLLRPDSDLVEPRFLFSVLASDYGRAHARRECKPAINQASLGQGEIKSLEIHLPSLIEQERIADILDTADAAIQQTEQLIAKLKQVKAGLLHDLLTRGLDEHGNLRDPEAHPEQFKVVDGYGRVPGEWEVEPLEKLANVIDPQPDHRAPPAVIDGEPYVGVGDFRSDGTINFESCRKVSSLAVDKQLNKFQIEYGDILFGKIGTIGKPRLLPLGRYALNANTVLIKPNKRTSYLFQVLNSQFVEQHIFEQLHSTSQPAFGIQKIRVIPIPTPPSREQDMMVEVLDANDGRIRTEEAYRDKLQAIKQGLMHDLLTGKVRV